jgi:integrase
MVNSFKPLSNDNQGQAPVKSRVRVIRTLAPRKPLMRLFAVEELAVLDAARREDARASFSRRIKELAAPDLAAADTQATNDARLRARRAAYRRARFSAGLLLNATSPTLEALIVLLLQTAISGSDAVQLQWTDLDEQAMTVMLPGFKYRPRRYLPLSPDLLALLQRIPRTSDHVFDFGGHGIAVAWQRFCRRSGLNTLTLRRLRNEALFRAIERFPNTLKLMAFLGHYRRLSVSEAKFIGIFGPGWFGTSGRLKPVSYAIYQHPSPKEI